MNPSVVTEREPVRVTTALRGEPRKANSKASERLLVVLAVVLCILCCSLFLSIPTESISVDTVYQGF